MEYLMSFLVSVGAQVIGHYLCKWHEPDDENCEKAQGPRRADISSGAILRG